VVDTPTYKNVTCKSGFTLEDDVSITVNDSYANGRNIYIEDADGNTVVSSECDSTYTIPASELGVGEYTVYFELYNNMGTTLTDRYSFGIYEYAPSYIDVTIDKTTYTVGETVTLNFNSEYATDYKVTILRDNGKVYHMSSTENTTYTTTLPLGNYSISVTAYNPAGSVTSSAIDVNVVSKTIGDVNGDNVLNYLDALTFKKYLLNIEDTTQNADLNGDGIVNIVDYIELMSLLEAKE
jgi:hypothetical protein